MGIFYRRDVIKKWKNLLVGFFMLLSVLAVGLAFSGTKVPEKEDLFPGRYQGVRINGVQGGMFVVDTASAKVKFCGVTPVGCSPWNY